MVGGISSNETVWYLIEFSARLFSDRSKCCGGYHAHLVENTHRCSFGSHLLSHLYFNDAMDCGSNGLAFDLWGSCLSLWRYVTLCLLKEIYGRVVS